MGLILMMVGILIAAGCVMETTPNIVILAPILNRWPTTSA
jgi:C4-dicarboxylate transporter DctM subunit